MKWMVFYVKFSQVSNWLHWEILSLCSLVISRKLNLIKRDCDLLYLFSELRIEDIQKFVNIRNTRCTKTVISCFVSDFSWQLNSSLWFGMCAFNILYTMSHKHCTDTSYSIDDLWLHNAWIEHTVQTLFAEIKWLNLDTKLIQCRCLRHFYFSADCI